MQKISENEKVACNKRREVITRADLPLACPPIGTRVWDAHPRVYLPIETEGKVVCPYCATSYVLKDFGSRESPGS